MKYFIDSEFYEDGKTIDLISIGVVTEDGREFYAVNKQARLDRVSPWVRDNVLKHLPSYDDQAWMHRVDIADRLRRVLFNPKNTEDTVEVWGYYADYDWVLLCQLYGTMMDLPKHFPRFCMDVKQLAVMKGNPKLPEQGKDGKHHALEDARWIKKAHDFLMEYEQPPKVASCANAAVTEAIYLGEGALREAIKHWKNVARLEYELSRQPDPVGALIGAHGQDMAEMRVNVLETLLRPRRDG